MLESVQVDLQDITLLEQAGRDNLINFANSGVGQIDYETYLAEVICVSVCGEYLFSHMGTQIRSPQGKSMYLWVETWFLVMVGLTLQDLM